MNIFIYLSYLSGETGQRESSGSGTRNGEPSAILSFFDEELGATVRGSSIIWRETVPKNRLVGVISLNRERNAVRMWAAVSFVACVAWRFCRATVLLSGEAANAYANEQRTREKNRNRLLGFVAFSTVAPSTHFDIPLTTCLVSISLLISGSGWPPPLSIGLDPPLALTGTSNDSFL